MSTDWDRFPVERMRRRTFLKRAVIHAELIRAALARGRGSILEVGVGSGAQSALLSHFARTVTVDNDLRILAAARENLERFGRRVGRVAADGFHLPFRDGAFGVSISQGLLEHFSDERIAELVVEQLRVAQSVAFSVPSDRYPLRITGDERFLTPERWARIIAGAVDPGRYAVRSRYYRFDPEALRHSIRARRRLGAFGILVTIDPR